MRMKYIETVNENIQMYVFTKYIVVIWRNPSFYRVASPIHNGTLSTLTEHITSLIFLTSFFKFKFTSKQRETVNWQLLFVCMIVNPWGLKVELLIVFKTIEKLSFIGFSQNNSVVFGKKIIVSENDSLVLNFKKTNNDRFWKR